MHTRFTRRAATCPICFDLIEFQGRIDSCKHAFCYSCIKAWAKVLLTQTKNKCPYCRQPFRSIKRQSQRVEYCAASAQTEEVPVPKTTAFSELAERIRAQLSISGQVYITL